MAVFTPRTNRIIELRRQFMDNLNRQRAIINNQQRELPLVLKAKLPKKFLAINPTAQQIRDAINPKIPIFLIRKNKTGKPAIAKQLKIDELNKRGKGISPF